jgi:hypothetical protein
LSISNTKNNIWRAACDAANIFFMPMEAMKEIAEKEAVRTQLKSDQKPAVEKVEAKFSR